MPPPNLIIVSLETSGPDPAQHEILELSAIALNACALETHRFVRVVNYDYTLFPEGHPRRPDQETIDLYTGNGLWAECLAATLTENDLATEFAEWLESIEASAVELAGLSPHLVLPFLTLRLPAAAAYFGDRLRDVGAVVRELVSAGKVATYQGRTASLHRATLWSEAQLNDFGAVRELLAQLHDPSP